VLRILAKLLGTAMKKGSSYNSWITLGPMSDFPEGETGLVIYRNPVTTSWDGQTGDIPCWVRRVSGMTFQVFANQLCASGLSGSMVCAVQALSVSVPWMGLLCRCVAAHGPFERDASGRLTALKGSG
jgi:hypothetical protein